MLDDLAHLTDVFFNGRPAHPKDDPPSPCKVTLPELIERKVSYVLVNKRLYKFTVEPVELTK